MRPVNTARLTLMEAIARQKIVIARYNGGDMRLAPHLLFERHGDLFVSAENVGKPPRADGARRLGQFKLAGLAAMELLDERFEPVPETPAAPRSDDVVILTV